MGLAEARATLNCSLACTYDRPCGVPLPPQVLGQSHYLTLTPRSSTWDPGPWDSPLVEKGYRSRGMAGKCRNCCLLLALPCSPPTSLTPQFCDMGVERNPVDSSQVVLIKGTKCAPQSACRAALRAIVCRNARERIGRRARAVRIVEESAGVCCLLLPACLSIDLSCLSQTCGGDLDQPLFCAATRMSDAVRRAVRMPPLWDGVASPLSRKYIKLATANKPAFE